MAAVALIDSAVENSEIVADLVVDLAVVDLAAVEADLFAVVALIDFADLLVEGFGIAAGFVGIDIDSAEIAEVDYFDIVAGVVVAGFDFAEIAEVDYFDIVAGIVVDFADIVVVGPDSAAEVPQVFEIVVADIVENSVKVNFAGTLALDSDIVAGQVASLIFAFVSEVDFVVGYVWAFLIDVEALFSFVVARLY